jgi:Zn-dependent peptidase ImmA (M78 family)
MALKVKYLPKQNIEWNAQKLLAEYGGRYGEVVAPPIPVEEILEKHLKLTLEIDNLAARLGHPDILGALWVPDKLVAIDESLEPSEHPSKEGRYRYTVGHEIGHWVQHRHYFLENPDQRLLFPKNTPEATVICRTSQSKDPMERQADYFSAYLLMPKEMVYSAWEKHHGSMTPYVFNLRNRENLRAMGFVEPDEILASMAIEFVAGEIAPIFRVSVKAMQIRLEELKLVQREDGSLFSMEEVA